MTTKALAGLSDEELDAAHMDVQQQRAEAEAEFKAKALEIQAEQDRRSVQKRIADVPDEVIAAIRAAKPAEEG